MGNSLAIYIGAENIDVVSLTGSFQHPHLASYARVKLPEKSSWREQIRVGGSGSEPAVSGTPPVAPPLENTDQEFINRSVQAMLSKLGIPPSTPIYAAIASESVVIRCFQMPAIPAHERKMAIAFEAKKYLPFKLEDLITDYQVVIRRSDPSLMRVMFFGVKKSSVAIYGSLFQYCRLLPHCLEPAPVSLMRLVRQNGQLPGGQQVAALISIEHDAATISIARDDLLYLSRNVTILRASGAPDQTPPELMEALLNETRISIDYYRRRFLGEPAVGKIIVFGSPEDSKRIQELFGSLELPVEIGDPFKRTVGSRAAPAGLSVSIGLALRGLENRARGINLLSPDERRASYGLLKPFLLQAAAAAVLLGAWTSVCFYDLYNFEQKIAGLRSQQVKIENVPINAGLAELREMRGREGREKSILAAFAELKTGPSTLLIELARNLPEEAWLQTLAFRNLTEEDPQKASTPSRRTILRIVGSTYANNREIEMDKITRFLAALQESPIFKSTFSKFSLDSAQRGSFQKEEVTEFRVTCASRAEDLRIAISEPRGGGRRMRP